MTDSSYSLGVNTTYNFHPAFHGEILDIIKHKIIPEETPLINYFEPLIRAPRGSFLSKHIISIGKFLRENKLLFSPHLLLTNSSKWIIELEHPYWLFTNHYHNISPDTLSFNLRRSIALKILRKNNCRFILTWSKKSQKAALDFFGDEISHKIKLVYPMVGLANKYFAPEGNVPGKLVKIAFVMPNKKHEEIRKGKDVALWLLEKLATQFQIKLIFVGYLTPSEKYKYGSLIENWADISREDMFKKVYSQADILIFPSRADTFGSVIIEAQSMGVIPIASTGRSVLSTAEIILDGKNGFLINNQATATNDLDFEEINKNNFLIAIVELLENRPLMRTMKQQCRENFLKSPFNPKNQLSMITKIFESAYI